MKKLLLTSAFFLFLGMALQAQPAWQTQNQCPEGTRPKPTANGPFKSTYETCGSSTTQKQGTQNHYILGGEVGSGKTSPVNAQANGSYSRDGEKTTKTTQENTCVKHEVTYDCVKPKTTTNNK